MTDETVCPVCGVATGGTGDAFRNHLVYEHGWDEDRAEWPEASTPSDQTVTD